MDADITASLARGSRTSPTLRALLDGLEQSDVIVYIEARWLHGGEAAGSTRFVTHAGGQRYLRVTVDILVQGDAAIALIGHELQHASEIARAPWVVDQATLDELYRTIGRADCTSTAAARYETAAAREVGWTVLHELRHGQRPPTAGAPHRGNLSGLSVKRASTPRSTR